MAQRANAFGDAPGALIRNAQVQMGDCILGIHGDRPLVPSNGRFDVALFEREVGKIRQRRRVPGVQRERLFKIYPGLSAALQSDARDAAFIQENGSVFRVETSVGKQLRKRELGSGKIAPIQRAQRASKLAFIPNHALPHVHD